MRDHDAILAEASEKIVYPSDQLLAGFATGRPKSQRVGGPTVEFSPWNVLPGFSFPSPEIQLQQARIGDCRYSQCIGDSVGQATASACWTGPNDNRSTQDRVLRQPSYIGIRVDRYVQPAITDTGLDQRRRMTHQNDSHAYFTVIGNPATINRTRPALAAIR